MTRTTDLVHEIVRLSSRDRNLPTENRLMSLVYLVHRGSAVSDDFEYLFPDIHFNKYRNGPYSKSVVDSIRQGNKNHRFHQISYENSRSKYYELCNCPDNDSPEISLRDKERKLVQNVFDAFRSSGTKELNRKILQLDEVESVKKYEAVKPQTLNHSNI